MKLKLSLIITLVGLFLFSNKAYSQEFEDLLRAGANDAETYLEKYFAPGINSFGNGMADGWYNTAKAHKTLGVDLTVSINTAFIPDSELMFNFSENDYENLQLRNDSDNILPTMVGGDAEEGSELVVPANATFNYPGGQQVTVEEEAAFDVPNGFNLNDVPVMVGVPTPTVNLGIGIYKSTDLKIRFVPEQNFGDFSARMFGIGVLHDVKQWIPAVKNLPFDLSGFFGTTTLTSEYAIDFEEQQTAPEGSSTFEGNGTATFKTNATTIQGIISKKLLFFTPYAAIGVNFIKSKFDVDGEYTYTVNPTLGEPRTTSVTDPIALEFAGSGGPRLTVGGRLKFAIFTFHGAYTLQKYNSFSAGLGISIR